MLNLEKSSITRVSIALVIVIFLALLAVAWFWLANTRQSISDTVIDQFGELQLEVAKRTAKNLVTELDNIEDKLKIISQIPAVKYGDTETCNAELVTLLGDVSIRGILSNIARIGKDGIFDCAVRKPLIGTDGTNFPYVKSIFEGEEHNAVLSRSFVFHYVENSEQKQKYLVALHIPLYDDEGIFQGSLGGGIYFDDLKEGYFGDIGVSQEGYTYLVDDDGVILYHDDPNLMGRNQNDEFFQQFRSESSAFAEMMDGSQSGLEGIKRHTFKHIDRLGVYAPAEVFPGRSWSVVIAAPISEIEGLTAPLIAIAQNQAFVFIGILLFLAFGSVIFLVRWNRTLEEKVKERTSDLAEQTKELAEKTRRSEADRRQLEKTVSEMEELNKRMVGRELKMIELKEEAGKRQNK